MRIINAKRSTLTMKTSSGQILTIKPGEVSNPFIADKVVIRTLTTLATPEEAGFVVTNSFELDLVRQFPIASQYLYQSVETAKAALLEGKKFDDPSVGTNAEVLKLRHEVESLKAEMVKATELVEVYKKKSEEMSSNDKQAELDAEIDEVKELKDQVYNLNSDNAELEKSNEELKKEVQAGNDAIKELINVKKDLEEKIKELESNVGQYELSLETNKSLQDSLNNSRKENKEIHELVDKLTTELEVARKKLESSALLPEQKEAIENYSKVLAENEALKKDGAELMQRYEKAKSSVTEIMEKFNISYVDGQWQQVASM